LTVFHLPFSFVHILEKYQNPPQKELSAVDFYYYKVLFKNKY